MAFSTFFSLSLNFAIRSSWAHDLRLSQLQVLFLLTVESFSIFSCKEYNQSYFNIDHLVMSVCRVISCVVGRGCLLWPAHSGKTLLALSCFILYCKTKLACHYRYLLTSYSEFQSPMMKTTGFLLLLAVLEGLVGLHRAIQFQLLWYQWLGHRLGLLWCWMICLRNKLRSFFLFWNCTQILHFGLLLTMRATPFLLLSCQQ